jgi:uncharacterized protein affecting Mg2+/Co2+ transport
MTLNTPPPEKSGKNRAQYIFNLTLAAVASVPVTLVMMFWVVRNATARIKTVPPEKNPPTEDTKRGTET